MIKNKIVIQNDYSWFVSEDIATKRKLWSCLRVKDRNYFHNPRYRQNKWDGYIDFFKLEGGKFLTGLLPEVQAALKKWEITHDIEDQRKLLDFKYQSVDKNFLNQWLPKKTKPIELHDYQVDFINQIIKHRRGIIHSPTSSGKTFLVVGTLKALPENTPALILQNRVSLAKQNYEEICRWGFKNVGTLWGNSVAPNIITVANIASIGKIEKLLPKFKVVIVDEIHEMMSKLPKAVYRRLKECSVRVALSATPFKFGEKDKVQKYDTKGFFGPVLKTKSTEAGILTTKELQDRNILSASKCTFYPIDEPQIPHDVYIDAVTHGIAESFYFHDIVRRLAALQKGRTLILVDRIAHGDALHGLIPNSLWVQGKDNNETRQHVIGELKNSKQVVAIGSQSIFNTGINFFCHNIINAAGGAAEHMIIQRMGRGLRTAKDKHILNYIDFIFNINDYLLQHSNKRVKILKKEGHDITIKDTIDF